MQYLIDYATFIFQKIVDLLNSIRLPGSSSLLFYFLGAIIIGFILKLVKGSVNEFEMQTNFLNGSTLQSATAKYVSKNRERKAQIIKEKRKNMVYEYMDDNF